ncbi:hypothetical protein LOC67_00190 [Stieleria sp. JC731]|uniref:hypothetical protein n=1 Tax=Pirellulaceae TaxID=2691357 RepID=UPI001E52DCC3|nr:hypothetical protein [Stieleria sp. JC731]MCC9598958.1 hypothetical protein [Stieleria sp. JC731]
MSTSSAFFRGRTLRSALCAILVQWTTVPLLATADDYEPSITEIKHGPIGDGTRHVYVGSMDLPADGIWRINTDGDQRSERVREIYLVPTNPMRVQQIGKRMYEAIEDRVIANMRWQIRQGHGPAQEYALEHKNIGPASLKELSKYYDEKHRYPLNWNRISYAISELEDVIQADKLEGPFVHLVPRAKFRFAERKKIGEGENERFAPREVPKDQREILAFQLRPLIDDGKHWVLYTDGACERVEIDSTLIKEQKVSIRPVLSKTEIDGAFEAEKASYTITAIAEQTLSGVEELSLSNPVTGQQLRLDWNLDDAKAIDNVALKSIVSDARRYGWRPYVAARSGGVLDVWNQKTVFEPSDDRRRDLTMFSILGGRAAIEETLQLQNLVTTDSEDEASVDLSTIEGVKVESHPFKSMLGDSEGGHLEMANHVPHDRFFIYVGKPESIPAMFDSGAPFIASIGTALSGNCLQYNLENRYLARLGLNREWVDQVLASGLTSEMSIYTPDLFFIDGTDVTVIARLRQPKLLQQMLSMLGGDSLGKHVTADRGVMEIPGSGDRSAYVALRDDLLYLSTNRHEIELSLKLREQNGEGSLGASDEFRYMLEQLSVNEETRLYAYFSDPFVRRLVGPEVKIGQHRRMLAKAQMEATAAMALKAKLNGAGQDISVAQLASQGYVPRQWDHNGLSIQPNGFVRSERYGALPNMRTLPETPIEKVTPAEAEAYERYRENYSLYWRQFFDPIAIRLNDVGRGELELSTFILPLVDNSIYNGLRSVLQDQGDQQELRIPVVQPTPVLQFSVNLRDIAWQQIAGNFSDFFSQYSGVSSAILDDFGPSAHVAVFDADPVIALGSGDVFGAFGGTSFRGRSTMMVTAPVFISMLTRPCSIMVETQSPERTARYLRQAAIAHSEANPRVGWAVTSFYQEGDQDRWVWTMDIMGVVKLRYGVEVVDKYLVIRNIPWSSNDRVVNTEVAGLNAAQLEVNPAACQEQLPGLHAAAADNSRAATMSGLGRLYPFMLAGADSVETAMADHQRMFGFHPRQFPGDHWSWENQLMVSEVYGQPMRQRQPAFDPQQPFGLMHRIESLKLNMQFESDGLRSTVRWRLK